MKDKFYENSLKIRLFEQGLLNLFSKGLIKGTTHTCIGQENNAVGVCSALKKTDIVLSNHRCHGHFLSHTGNFEGLLNEILGKENGVCKGVGGSQHLFYNKVFYSNGILGGNLPMGVGLAKAKKIKKEKNIVCIFLGDGAFGEGVLYECFNLISLYSLPVLIVIEDNEIAQTTNSKDTTAGSLYDRCKGFELNVEELKYPDAFEISLKTKKLVKKVRKNRPQVLILKSTRLGPHSKGDDTRNKATLKKLQKLDPLLKLESKIKKKKLNKIQVNSQIFIKKLYNKCLNEKNIISKNENFVEINSLETPDNKYLENFKGRRFGELINHYLINLAKKNSKFIFLGEDIDDPYGGAFKITKGIKSNLPKQIFSTPISEASIIGMSGGLAIEGFKPIVEIMFGDFLTLGFDQILNNLSKFHYMYNKGVNLPLVIRTPMGAGRGYGPTHSQSIEKHFFGIIGLNIFVATPFFPLENLYEHAFRSKTPSLMIENKLQYNFILSDLNDKNSYLSNFNKKLVKEDFISIFSLSNFENEDCTIFCYGGVSELALKAAHKLFIEHEISLRVVIISRINDMEKIDLSYYVSDRGHIFTLEESSKNFGFGSEILSLLSEHKKLKDRKYSRISSSNVVIPSSIDLEKKMLVSVQKIIEKIEKKLNV